MEKSDVSYIVGGIVDIRGFATFNSIHGREAGDQLLHELKQHVSGLIAVGINSYSCDGDEVVFWTEALEMLDLRKHILEIEGLLRDKHHDFRMWCGFSRTRKENFDVKHFYRSMNQSLPQIKMSNKALHPTAGSVLV
jgi:GGDEF domain-containing protein